MPKFHTCKTCKKRNGCRRLCDKARNYVDQDQVKRQELTVGVPIATEKISEFALLTGTILTDRELQILMLSEINGFTRKEISKSLRISMTCLRFHLFNLRQKIDPK